MKKVNEENKTFHSPGLSWKAKVSEIRGRLKEKDAYAVIVAALDEVACEHNFCQIFLFLCGVS